MPDNNAEHNGNEDCAIGLKRIETLERFRWDDFPCSVSQYDWGPPPNPVDNHALCQKSP